jgi:rod shape-determining protein MreD
VAPVLVIGDVHPNIVLVAVVLVTTVSGFGPGIGWAFVGGLTANLLTRDPLGSLPLGLLLVAAAVAGGERLFGRLAWGFPLAAVAIGSVLVDLLGLAILRMVDAPQGAWPMQLVLAAAVLNTAIAAIVLVPLRILVARAGGSEKAAW